MAKVFKTISLEERWKNSVHNKEPQKIKTVNQGSTTVGLPNDVNQGFTNIKPQDTQTKALDIQLKKLTNIDMTSRVLPTIKSSEMKALEDYQTPFVNTKYRTAISLSDRLEQSATLSSTNHLPQYFLSDVYTNYIKVKSFGIFNHTSTIVLDDNTFTPNQGGTNLTPFIFDSLFFQGTIKKNGNTISISNITQPKDTTQQGFVSINGISNSFVNVEPSLPTSQLQQDLHINPTLPKSVANVGLTQGLLELFDGSIGSISTIEEPNVSPSQGGTDAVPFNYSPDRTPVNPSVLRYAADRAMAYFTPRIKHGSVYVEPLPDYYETGAFPESRVTGNLLASNDRQSEPKF